MCKCVSMQREEGEKGEGKEGGERERERGKNKGEELMHAALQATQQVISESLRKRHVLS